MNSPITDEMIQTLARFGFNFFASDENGNPLVTAPNGQVISAEMAYKFLQSELAKSKSGSIEIPNIEIQPQISIVEEVQQTVERPVDSIDTKNIDDSNIQKKEIINSIKTPKVEVNTSSNLFSDGYNKFQDLDLDLSKEKNIESLEKYIEKNAKKDNTDPKKWLSLMLQKVLLELEHDDK